MEPDRIGRNVDIFKKKQKNIEPKSRNRNTEGDAWIYTAIKRSTYFFTAFSIGKRTQRTCKKLIEQLSEKFIPLKDSETATFYSDGNDDYTYTLPQVFPVEKLTYGQLIKIKKGGRLVKKIKTAVFGNPCMENIETTDVENHNGIMRERLGRLVRKTKCFSKIKKTLNAAVDLFQFHWNFMDVLKEKKTPAMLESISTEVISWHDFLYYVKYS